MFLWRCLPNLIKVATPKPRMSEHGKHQPPVVQCNWYMINMRCFKIDIIWFIPSACGQLGEVCLIQNIVTIFVDMCLLQVVPSWHIYIYTCKRHVVHSKMPLGWMSKPGWWNSGVTPKNTYSNPKKIEQSFISVLVGNYQLLFIWGLLSIGHATLHTGKPMFFCSNPRLALLIFAADCSSVFSGCRTLLYIAIVPTQIIAILYQHQVASAGHRSVRK